MNTRAGDWREDAACRDAPNPDDWFPGRGESARAALEVCGVCPVTAECLEYALRWSCSHGVWGNTSERERRGMRRRVA